MCDPESKVSDVSVKSEKSNADALDNVSGELSETVISESSEALQVEHDPEGETVAEED